jgi:hypothetical protein
MLLALAGVFVIGAVTCVSAFAHDPRDRPNRSPDRSGAGAAAGHQPERALRRLLPRDAGDLR